MLVEAGEHVEDGGLADVGLAGQGDGQPSCGSGLRLAASVVKAPPAARSVASLSRLVRGPTSVAPPRDQDSGRLGAAQRDKRATHGHEDRAAP